MSETKAPYNAGPQASGAACFNCENGKMLRGQFGRYCFECDMYLPIGGGCGLVDDYFDALDAGDNGHAAEIKKLLEHYRAETIRTAQARPIMKRCSIFRQAEVQ